MTTARPGQRLLERFRSFDHIDPTAEGPICRESEILVWWITAALWAAVLTQRIALPPANIELCFFLMIGFVAFLFYRRLLFIEQKRAIAYFGLIGILLAEQLFTAFREPFSIPALLAAMGYYSIFMFVAPMERSAVYRVMRSFVGVATFIGFMVFVDWGFNLTHHALPNMDKYVPDSFIFLHYVYVQPVHWLSPYTKPNAFFMLEASHTSQMIAMGIVVEFLTRQNLIRMGFLSAALLATYAGTGILLLVICLPFILPRAKSTTLVVALMIGPLVLGGAFAKGLLTDYTRRQAEFGQQGESANQRFVWPYQLTWKQMNSDAHDLVLGIGASNAAYDSRLPVVIKGRPNGAPAYGTPTKLIIEFGVFIAVIWSLYFWIILARGQVPVVIMVMMFVQYEFLNGGLLVPIEIFYCYLMCAMYVKPDPSWDVSKRLKDYASLPGAPAIVPAE